MARERYILAAAERVGSEAAQAGLCVVCVFLVFFVSVNLGLRACLWFSLSLCLACLFRLLCSA